MPDRQTFTDEEVEKWTRASCAAQGVPVKVADPMLVRRVGALLGVDPGVRGGGGWEARCKRSERASHRRDR
jgi:hypothetical protein